VLFRSQLNDYITQLLISRIYTIDINNAHTILLSTIHIIDINNAIVDINS